MDEKKSHKAEASGSGRIRLPELLAPAGNLEKLITAVHYGADAVYLGGKNFSLRAKAGNFSEEDLRQGVIYAHEHGTRVYATVNIFAHNRDLDGLADHLIMLADAGVDGLIIADPGVLSLAKELVPNLSLHLSTQANVTNHRSAAFWVEQGVNRLNLARELSLEEIREVRRNCMAELEVFVHGALCISYSGRCMLSNYMTGRDANQGSCAHPCRFSYQLVEEKRPGQFYPVEEDSRGTYIFNSKDLCLLSRLPELVAAGVDSLKIEGRMKSIFYVGGVVRVYRAALDYLASLDGDCWKNPEQIAMPQELLEEIMRLGTRGTTENFFDEPPDAAQMIYTSSRASQPFEPIAVVREVQEGGKQLLVEMRNCVEPGEDAEYMGRGLSTRPVRVVGFVDGEGRSVEKANPGNLLQLQTEPVLENAEPHGILRRRKKA